MNNSKNHKLKQVRHFVFTTLFLSSFVSVLEAQSLNDEFKLKLKESLVNPEKPVSQQQHAPTLSIQDQMQNDKVLKVSPYTKLPTKGDKLIIVPIQEVKINLNLKSSTPVNMKPRGSMSYVQNGKGLSMESNAGKMIKPSGFSISPPRGRSEKRARTVRRIVENWY